MHLALKKCRMDRRLSIRELAGICKLSKTTIHDIEQGLHYPTLENYVTICTALNIEPYNELLIKE